MSDGERTERIIIGFPKNDSSCTEHGKKENDNYGDNNEEQRQNILHSDADKGICHGQHIEKQQDEQNAPCNKSHNGGAPLAFIL